MIKNGMHMYMYWVQSHYNGLMFKECKKPLPNGVTVPVKTLSLFFAVLLTLLGALSKFLGTCLLLACLETF